MPEWAGQDDDAAYTVDAVDRLLQSDRSLAVRQRKAAAAFRGPCPMRLE